MYMCGTWLAPTPVSTAPYGVQGAKERVVGAQHHQFLLTAKQYLALDKPLSWVYFFPKSLMWDKAKGQGLSAPVSNYEEEKEGLEQH